MPTVSGVFGGADWNEREAWELYGVSFAGHPNLTWLLLPEGTGVPPAAQELHRAAALGVRRQPHSASAAPR